MPVHTNRPGVDAPEPDGPFALLAVAGQTRVPAGERWHVQRPQGMEGWILHLNLAGAGQIRWAGRLHRSEPGELMRFAPEAVHDYDRHAAAAVWHHSWVYFRPRSHWLPWLAWPGAQEGIASLRLEGGRRARVENVFDDLIRCSLDPGPFREEQVLNRLERILLDCAETFTSSSGRWQDERINRACAFIDERLREAIGVREVAEAVGLSESRLSHLFAERVGLGVLRYRDEQRMLQARQLLQHTGMPVQRIAQQVGYDDALYFARVFRRLVGSSPSAFRQGGA